MDKRYRKRLLVGEGDFNFSVAFVKKHPEVIDVVTATEYQDEEHLAKRPKFCQNRDTLEKKGVQMYLGVDATKLHMHSILSQEGYSRIHFNFPYTSGSWKKHNHTRELVKNFFASCSQIQDKGQRIMLTLPEYTKPQAHFFYGFVYGLYDAALNAGYKPIKKRYFNAKRFPGYIHNKTGESTAIKTQGYEYVFVKEAVSRYEISKLKESLSPINRYDYDTFYHALPDVETCDESSEYEDEPLDIPVILKKLKDKNQVVKTVSIQVGDGKSQEMSQLLLKVLPDVGGYWDIDGGFQAIALLGNYFNQQHAAYMSNRVKSDADWRAVAVKEALESLLRTTTFPSAHAAILDVLSTLMASNPKQAEGVVHQFKQLSHSQQQAAVNYLFRRCTGNDFCSLDKMVKEVDSHFERLKAYEAVIKYLSLEITQTNCQWAQVNTSVIAKNNPSELIQYLWQQISKEDQMRLIKASLADKSTVYSSTLLILEHELISGEQLATLLLNTAKQQMGYWDIDGGIAAMGLLGKFITALHIDYFIARIEEDETWRAQHVLAGLKTILMKTVPQVILDQSERISQCFKVPENQKALGNILNEATVSEALQKQLGIN